MLTRFLGSGLHISLGIKDKKQGNKKGYLKSRLESWKNPQVILRITDKVEKRDAFEEKGFHIKVTPKISSPEERTKYEIFLSKENWNKLTNPKDKVLGGYFVSRCMYDRVDIVYH